MIAKLKLPGLTEAQFQTQLLGLAKLLGWWRVHFRPARTATGWRTPVEGDGKGFPDVILVRERVIYTEAKSDTGRLRPDQEAWLARLKAAGQEVYLWRPRDWREIERILQS
jgi:hypothetical protein